MNVRCDVAQVTIYFPRYGRVWALGHCYPPSKGSALWHREESCVEQPCVPCPAVLGWALVTGARH